MLSMRHSPDGRQPSPLARLLLEIAQFIPSLAVLSAFTAASLVLNLTPGPDMTLSVGRTLSHGMKSGMAAMAGTTAGGLVHTLAAATGLSLLLAASETAFTALKIIGAIYLLWLAFQAIRKGSAFNIGASEKPRRSLWRDFTAGLSINLLNPKIVVFFLTFLPQFVVPNDPDAAGKLLFLGLWFSLFAMVPMSLMIVFASQVAGTLRRKPAIARMIDYLFATIFAAFALRLLVGETR